MSVSGIATTMNDIALVPQVVNAGGDVLPTAQGNASFSQVLQEHSVQDETPTEDHVAENMESAIPQVATLLMVPMLDLMVLNEESSLGETPEVNLPANEKKISKFDPDLILGLVQKKDLQPSAGDFEEQLTVMDERKPLAQEGEQQISAKTEDSLFTDLSEEVDSMIESSVGEKTNASVSDESFESRLAQGDPIKGLNMSTEEGRRTESHSKGSLPLSQENLVESLNFIEDKPKIKSEGLSQPEQSLTATAEGVLVAEVMDETQTQGDSGEDKGKNPQESLVSLQKNADKKVVDSTAEKNQAFREVGPSVTKDSKMGQLHAGDLSQVSPNAVTTSRQEPFSLTELIATPPSNRSQQNEQFLARGIEKTVQFLKEDGVAQARIVVDPPALGRVDISLSATDKGIEALIRVDNEALKQAVQSQIEQLRQNLADQGIQAASLSVDIRHGDDKGRNVAQSQKKLKRSFAEEEDEEQVAMVRLDLEKGLLHWVA